MIFPNLINSHDSGLLLPFFALVVPERLSVHSCLSSHPNWPWLPCSSASHSVVCRPLGAQKLCPFHCCAEFFFINSQMRNKQANISVVSLKNVLDEAIKFMDSVSSWPWSQVLFTVWTKEVSIEHFCCIPQSYGHLEDSNVRTARTASRKIKFI